MVQIHNVALQHVSLCLASVLTQILLMVASLLFSDLPARTEALSNDLLTSFALPALTSDDAEEKERLPCVVGVGLISKICRLNEYL